MRPTSILPVILACPVDPERSYQFFQSYESVVRPLGFQRPVVMVGVERNLPIPGEYFDTLNRFLDPVEIQVHARSRITEDVYYSVEDALKLLLEAGIRLHTGTHLMFIEDDIIFFPNFKAELNKVDQSRSWGFITFWHTAAHKVAPDSNELDPFNFWGSQCLLMPISTVFRLVLDHEHMKATYPRCWDIYWSRHLAAKGFKMYCTDESCVGEIPGPPRLQHP